MITSKFIKAEGYKILFAMAITVLYYIILGLLSVIPDEPLVPYAMSVIGVAVGIALRKRELLLPFQLFAFVKSH